MKNKKYNRLRRYLCKTCGEPPAYEDTVYEYYVSEPWVSVGFKVMLEFKLYDVFCAVILCRDEGDIQRVTLGLYNNKRDIEALLACLKDCNKLLD